MSARFGRAIAGLLAGAAWLAGVASCTSILGLDGYTSASQEFCTLVSRCYSGKTVKGCAAHVDAQLDANEDARATWLEGFDRCADNCDSAKECLNDPPLCLSIGSRCDGTEDCCQFLTGEASCDESRNECCIPPGVACRSNADCCGSLGCDDIPEDEAVALGYSKVCGGVACQPAGNHCTVAKDCCSNNCKNGACVAQVCANAGEHCASSDDCCPATTCNSAGKCERQDKCKADGASCKSGSECCDERCGLTLASPDQAICVPKGDAICAGLDSDCSTNEDCCSGDCDPQKFRCGSGSCVGRGCGDGTTCCDGYACASGSCCSVSTCTQDSDCCTNECVGGACASKCGTAGCAHDPCTAGEPLADTCPAATCVTAICTKDPYCCSCSWDALCVSLVLDTTACANACTTQ